MGGLVSNSQHIIKTTASVLVLSDGLSGALYNDHTTGVKESRSIFAKSKWPRVSSVKLRHACRKALGIELTASGVFLQS